MHKLLNVTTDQFDALKKRLHIISETGADKGDEGKGGQTDNFVKELHRSGKKVFVVSPNGGSGAGHTTYTNFGTNNAPNWIRHNTNILPASIREANIVFLGDMKLLNLVAFQNEINRITKGPNPLVTMEQIKKKVFISNQAKITFLPAIIQELLNEQYKSTTSGGKVGTTLQGISTTLAQYDIKAPCEVVTYLKAKADGTGFDVLPDDEIRENIDEYYKVIGIDVLLETYLLYIEKGKIEPIKIKVDFEEIVIGGKTVSGILETIREIDFRFLKSFLDTFSKNKVNEVNGSSTINDSPLESVSASNGLL